MTVINLTHYPFADGSTPTGTQVSEVFYLPANVPVSLDGLNGHLDKTNADASFTQVTYDQVQENSFHYAGQSSGTANLDYFKNWFEEFDFSAAYGDPELTVNPLPKLKFGKIIPGASQTFYLPYDCLVVFSWTVAWGNDSRRHQAYNAPTSWGGKPNGSNAQFSAISFFIDNAAIQGQWRLASRSVWWLQEKDSVGSIPNPVLGVVYPDDPTDPILGLNDYKIKDHAHVGMVKNRYWHGHYTVTLEAGWHSADLRLLAGTSVVAHDAPAFGASGKENYLYDSLRQTRVWARSLRYVALRKGGGE